MNSNMIIANASISQSDSTKQAVVTKKDGAVIVGVVAGSSCGIVTIREADGGRLLIAVESIRSLRVQDKPAAPPRVIVTFQGNAFAIDGDIQDGGGLVHAPLLIDGTIEGPFAPVDAFMPEDEPVATKLAELLAEDAPRVGGTDDWYECPCGNTPDSSGFYFSTADGVFVADADNAPEGRPFADQEWDGQHYQCADCGRVIATADMAIVTRRVALDA